MENKKNNLKYFFEIKKEDLYYFSLKDEEGKTYLESGSFTQKINCRNGIISVKRNFTNNLLFEIFTEEQKWRFYLKSGNGRKVVTSAPFDTEDEIQGFTPIIRKINIIDVTGKNKIIRSNFN